ncbi:MAG: hypothetical protein IJO75_06165 [Clostridia bacterium]|nr:hypothetical protein [Clostridia bacterium]
MTITELREHVYNGENLLIEVLDCLLDRKQSNDLLCAISERIPIMIYERCAGECGDGLLYRALKNIGVPCVKSNQTEQDVGLMNNNCAFYTVYLVKRLDEQLINSNCHGSL